MLNPERCLARIVEAGQDSLKSDVTAVMAALERARVVAVLDGWVQATGRHLSLGNEADGFIVFTMAGGWRLFGRGSTPDEARAKAAAAIDAGEV